MTPKEATPAQQVMDRATTDLVDATRERRRLLDRVDLLYAEIRAQERKERSALTEIDRLKAGGVVDPDWYWAKTAEKTS